MRNKLPKENWSDQDVAGQRYIDDGERNIMIIYITKFYITV